MADPAQNSPKDSRQDKSIAIDEASGSGKESEVVGEMGDVVGGEGLGDGAGEEEDEDDGGGDPEWAVEVWVWGEEG